MQNSVPLPGCITIHKIAFSFSDSEAPADCVDAVLTKSCASLSLSLALSLLARVTNLSAWLLI